MSIKELRGMSDEQVRVEIQNGGRIVVYQYCISLIRFSWRRSAIRFVRGHESPVVKGLPYVVLTVLLGWWGIPWGPIWSIGSIYKNLNGGRDITAEVMGQIAAEASPGLQRIEA